MYKELYFHGIPVAYKDICLIYTPTVSEILVMGRAKYSRYVELLTIGDIEIDQLYKNIEQKNGIFDPEPRPKPFDFLLSTAHHDSDASIADKNKGQFFLDLKKAFRTFLREDVEFLYEQRKILIGSIEEHRVLDEDSFFEFQNIIREMNRRKMIEKAPEDETEIAKKFRMRREEREYWKRKQKEKGSDEQKVKEFVTLESCLCAFGVGITPFNVGDLPIFAFYELLDKCTGREHRREGFQVLLNSANPKDKKLDEWIQDSEQE